MGTILGEGPGVPDEQWTLSEAHGPRGTDLETSSPASTSGSTVFWEEQPKRMGITFNLSKQLNMELDKLRQELRLEADERPSKSEITEAALRIAVEDVRRRGKESLLFRRLNGGSVDQIVDVNGGTTEEGVRTTRRSVDEAGFIVETTYDENGEIADEEMVAAVADLPVEAEYVDEEGRLVSLAKDELGNIFEWVMDEEFNTLGARIVRGEDQDEQ